MSVGSGAVREELHNIHLRVIALYHLRPATATFPIDQKSCGSKRKAVALAGFRTHLRAGCGVMVDTRLSYAVSGDINELLAYVFARIIAPAVSDGCTPFF